MAETQAHTPQCLWAETKEFVFITVQVSAPQDLEVDLKDESLDFKCVSDKTPFAFHLNFPERIKVAESKYSVQRNVQFKLVKVENKRWHKVSKDGKKLHWMKCDWDKWIDSDEEDSRGMDMGDFDMNAMDFGGMGGMGGMGGGMGGMGGISGMGGMAGLGGMGDLGSMGGMGNMGGLGGLGGGAGGMGDMDFGDMDDADSDDAELTDLDEPMEEHEEDGEGRDEEDKEEDAAGAEEEEARDGGAAVEHEQERKEKVESEETPEQEAETESAKATTGKSAAEAAKSSGKQQKQQEDVMGTDAKPNGVDVAETKTEKMAASANEDVPTEVAKA